MAFLVEDAYQGKGISTVLLEKLAGIAAGSGYIEFIAEVLPDNQPMLNVFKNSGFSIHQVWDSDSVHIEFPVSGGAQVWEQAALRERVATANSLIPILKPKRIAVIGASRDTNSIGNIIFRNIISNGYTGTVYPINPNSESINGVKAYKSLKDLPESIDLAVIAIPAKNVIDAANKAADRGAKGLIVVSAGFAESGQEGRERQRKLIEVVKNRGMRLIGPSCLGVMNTDNNVRLNASLAPELPPKGSAGFFSHSAALGLVILDFAKEKGIGFTTYVSAGNRADVSGNDLLQYWHEDSSTKMAILYLETFGNPRKFVRIARGMAREKPILCIKSAKSKVGRKAAEEKTGFSGGGKEEVESLFQQAGIIVADTLEELFDIAMVLTHQPLPEGNKVGIIANSSGFATLFADSCETNGLYVEEENLLNLGAFATPEDYKSAVKKLHLKEKVHSILIGYACVGNCNPFKIADSIREGIIEAEEKSGKEKPILLCLMGHYGTIPFEKPNEGIIRHFPAFRFPESAPKALGRIVNYIEFKKKPAGKIVWFDDIKGEKAREICRELIENIKEEKPIPLSYEIINDIIHYANLPESKRDKEFKCVLNIKPDPVFGPLIRLEPKEKKPIIRITPLTDNDIEEMLESLNMPHCKALKEVLGRTSQLIEEIPWLWSMKVYLNEDGIIPDKTEITLNPLGFKIKYK